MQVPKKTMHRSDKDQSDTQANPVFSHTDWYHLASRSLLRKCSFSSNFLFSQWGARRCSVRCGGLHPGPFGSLPCSSSVGHCPDPVLLNGKFSFRWPVKMRDRITFRCDDHYILKGGNWSQCHEDHTWVPPLPSCKSSKYSRSKCNPPRCWSTLAGRRSPNPLDGFLSCVANPQPRNMGSSGSRASAPVLHSSETSSIQWTMLFSFLKLQSRPLGPAQAAWKIYF